jgi:hypothetical protein
MPPRIQTKLVTNTLLPCLHSSSASSASLVSASSSQSPSSRPFSSTAAPQTRLREQMFEWLGNEGQELKTHTPGVPNYITTLRDRREKRAAEQSGDQEAAQESDAGQNARPFPLNPWFVSESVLSEELRGEIFQRVAVQKQNIREVSVNLGVDMRRIGAVVRLVELERRWRQQVCISLGSVLVSAFLCNDAKQNIFFD